MTSAARGVVALIPARGGSKGVPRKNVRMLRGHPLIAFSIVAAKRCADIARVIVSTDSPEIADVARAYGAEVPFLRPAALAQDTSADLEVVQHALQWFQRQEGQVPELLVQLRPTTPLRDPARIGEAVRWLAAHDGATALRSVHELAEPPQKMMGIQNGFLAGLFPDDPRPESFNLPRQAFPPAYHPNGYVDVVKSRIVGPATLYGPRVLAYVTPVTVEVDRPEDFEYVEYLIEKHNHPLREALKDLSPGLMRAGSARV